MSDIISAGKKVRILRTSEALPDTERIPKVRVLQKGEKLETIEAGDSGLERIPPPTDRPAYFP